MLEFNEKPKVFILPEDDFNMTNPVPPEVDPDDFWHAVNIVDVKYHGDEKFKPGSIRTIDTPKGKEGMTYVEKIVRETRARLPELLELVEKGKKEGQLSKPELIERHLERKLHPGEQWTIISGEDTRTDLRE
jgi:hypothetical protein